MAFNLVVTERFKNTYLKCLEGIIEPRDKEVLEEDTEQRFGHLMAYAKSYRLIDDPDLAARGVRKVKLLRSNYKIVFKVIHRDVVAIAIYRHTRRKDKENSTEGKVIDIL